MACPVEPPKGHAQWDLPKGLASAANTAYAPSGFRVDPLPAPGRRLPGRFRIPDRGGFQGNAIFIGDWHAMSETAEKVKKIVVEHLGVDEAKVTEDASFIDDLGADSLDTVELVMAFEEAFGVEIPDDAAEKITTVKDAIAYIDGQKS